MADVYSSIRVSPEAAQWMRAHKFTSEAVSVARALREVADIEQETERLARRREYLLRVRLPELLVDVEGKMR